jgi:ubiquinone/menaquinone biosynthesis C-methylase UbiE
MKPADTRAKQARLWSAVAPDGDCFTRDWGAGTKPVTDCMIEMLRPRPGDRVLDLACGKGEPALTLARLVAPDGFVLGLDISAGMIHETAHLARDLPPGSVEFRQIASESELGVPDENFDAATCRFGLMFMPDPAGALRAVRAALRSGGRVVVSTWANSSFAQFRSEIVAKHAPGSDVTPSQAMLAFNSAPALEETVNRAGFGAVETRTVSVIAIGGPDAAEVWDRESRISVAIREMLAPLSEDARRSIRRDAIASMRTMFGDGPIEFPADALVCRGTSEAHENHSQTL